MTDDVEKIGATASTHDALALLGAAGFRVSGPHLDWDNIEQAAEVLGLPRTFMPRSLAALNEMLTADNQKARAMALDALSWDGAQYKAIYTLTREDGTALVIEERGQRLAGDGRQASDIRGVVRDITEQVQSEKTTAYRAHYDAASGLWNRARGREALQAMADISNRFDRPALAVICRVRDLTGLNQTYGYVAADRVLQDCAARISRHLSPPDFAARLTGSSFLIGLHDVDKHDANTAINTLLAAMTAGPFLTASGRVQPRFLWSSLPVTGNNFSATLAIDTLLASTQSSERSADLLPSIIIPSKIDDTPQKSGGGRNKITESDIVSALNSRRIKLVYQPVVHARSRAVHHHECLIRMQREDGGVIPAGDFIPAAEKLDLVHLLDRRALEIAAQTLRQTPGIHLALNISAATVRNDIAVADYLQTLNALGTTASRLTLELTETVAIEDPARASQFSTSARALGCTFSIDDFGAGHTTFQNLMAIEADEIKIDGSFIRDLSTSPHKQAFVRIMVDLAQTFSVKTVAEFVATRQDADMLTRFGVDYLQGYLFGAPTPSPNWRKIAADRAKEHGGENSGPGLRGVQSFIA